MDEAKGAIRELVARVAQAAGAPGWADGDPDAVPAPRSGEPSLPDPAWASHLAETAAAEATACAAQVRAHRAALDQAQDRLRAAERLADRQRRRTEALRTRDQIDQDAPGIEELRGELAAALRGAEVTPALDQAERTARALAGARDAEARARAAVALIPDARPQATAADCAPTPSSTSRTPAGWTASGPWPSRRPARTRPPPPPGPPRPRWPRGSRRPSRRPPPGASSAPG